MLLSGGAKVDAKSALLTASDEGHKEVVQILLEQSANVNAESELCGNVLSVASAKGHKTVVQLLLGKGVNVNAESKLFGSALPGA